MPYSRIFVDVDGVLADFMGQLLHNYNQKYGTNYKHADIKDWNFGGIFHSGRKWQDHINHDFWVNLPLLPWAHQLVETIRATKKPYAFLTSLPNGTGTSVEDRRMWLDKHFMIDPKDPPSKRMIVACRKDLVINKSDIMVDDSPDNVAAGRSVGATVLPMAQPWNPDIVGRMTPEEIMDFLYWVR
jgi:5'(3')-deoxyribonucleotidase